MHKSPLLLFLILLIVLVISVLLCNLWNAYCREGLIGFGSSVKDGSGVKAGFYNASSPGSNPDEITKLHDSLFFDEKNARLIHMTGVDSNAPEATRNAVSKMAIYERDSTKSEFPITYTNTGEAGSSYVVGQDFKYTNVGVKPSYSSSVYTITETDPSLNNYSVLYIPWGMSTFIHVIDITNNTHVNTYAQLYNPNTQQKTFLFTTNNPVQGLSQPTTMLSSSSPTLTNLSDSYWPGRECVKLMEHIYVDAMNGNLVVYPTADGVSSAPTVYNRYNNNAEVAPAVFNESHSYFMDANIKKPTFNDVSELRVQIINAPHNIQILYVSMNKSTLVAIIKKTNNEYGLLNILRLESDGTYNNTAHGNDVSGAPKPTEMDKQEPDKIAACSETKQAVMDPDQYLDYFYSHLTGDDNNKLNDYILKTQIVPPVCPACNTSTCATVQSSGTPAPPANGTAGTPAPPAKGTAQTAGTPAPPANRTTQTAGDLAKGVVSETAGLAKGVVSETAGLAKNVVSETTDLAKETASGAVGLAKETVSGAAGLAKETASGAVGLVKDTASGAVGLAKDFISGTLGLTQDVVSGVVGPLNRFDPRDNRQMPSGANTNGIVLPPTKRGMIPPASVGSDPYSYYGQLSTKPSAGFRPLTADFSSFGR